MSTIREIMQAAELADNFFDRCVDAVGIGLIGSFLLNRVNNRWVGGQILEGEAYCQHDPAAHCYGDLRDQPSDREVSNKARMHDSMYLSPGHIYIFPKSRYCHLNFVCRERGFGAGVLIRSILPLEECVADMVELRKPFVKYEEYLSKKKRISSGPITLTQALGITPDLDGKPLRETSLRIFAAKAGEKVLADRRIGIPSSKANNAASWLRRYVLEGAPLGFYKPLLTPTLITPAVRATTMARGDLSKCHCDIRAFEHD